MTTESTTPATDGPLTTLVPEAGHLTIINTCTVAPERAEDLVELLVRATVDTLRYVPGCISADFHISLDRTQVVNHGQ